MGSRFKVAVFVFSAVAMPVVGCSPSSGGGSEGPPPNLPLADPALLGGGCSGGTSIGDAVAIETTDCESGLCLVDAREDRNRVYCTVDCTKFACPEGYTCEPTTLRKKTPVCTSIPVVCGDGIVGQGELCDDGNVSDGDACSSDCKKRPRVVLELQVAELEFKGETVKYPKKYYFDEVAPPTAKYSCEAPYVMPLDDSQRPFLLTPFCKADYTDRNVYLTLLLPDAVGTYTLGDDQLKAGAVQFFLDGAFPDGRLFGYGAVTGSGPIAGEKGTLVVDVVERDGARIIHEAGSIDLAIPSCTPEESCARWVRATGRFEVNDVTPRAK